ncbi:MAG TPA: LamG-like jellyroll fold domain-containing protein [Terriglobales bacterium]|nr:LamG-like jellyroll fold domain-containing protein [Terriglobales bacterium]
MARLAGAAAYYVAPAGSDSNPGTLAAPFLTLQQGVNRAVAGDTVIVRDGTYGHVNSVTGGDSSGNEYAPVVLYNSGTAGAWITIKAEHKGAAVLDCEMLCDAYINLGNASYIVIQDLVITRGYKEAIHSNDSAHHITLRGNRFEYIANRSTSTTLGLDGLYANPNCHDFLIDGNVFHDIGRTNVNWLDHGLYLHGSNYTIINNLFYNIPHGWSIQTADGLSNVLIANNTFAFPNGGGQDGQIMLWNTQSNLTIRDNIFYTPQNYAITRYTSSIASCSIDHNLVYGASGMMADASGCTLGTNQIGANPMFTNASSAPFDFHVQAGGSGIDTGMNIAAVGTDFDLNARPQGSSADIGAFEYVPPVIVPPPVISGVFTSSVLPTSVVINWTTDQPSTSSVQYGLSSYTMNTPTDATLVTQHSVTLFNLTASTSYHFRVSSTNSSGGVTVSPDSTFTTAALSTAISLSAATSTLSVMQGQSATDGVTALLLSGLPASVAFSASSLPAGVTAAFSAANCTATCSTTLTLATSSSTPTGVFPLMISGTGSGFAASTTVSLSISAATNLASGLMALWNFNELRGVTTADSSGNGNTGTLQNVSWASNVCASCISLSGSNSYVSVSESSSLEGATQITVSMWLRPNSNGNVDPRTVSKLYSWDVKLNGSSRAPQFSATGMYGRLNYSLALNQWQHLVFTFSSGVLKGYVNGKPVAFTANTFAAGSTLPLQMYGLYLGTDPSRSASYKGYMDDVRIYNRVLSDTDVASLYATTLH